MRKFLPLGCGGLERFDYFAGGALPGSVSLLCATCSAREPCSYFAAGRIFGKAKPMALP
jgi:hypothetical protein